MEGLRRLRVSVQIGGRCRPSNSRRLSSEKASQQDPAHWACVGRAFCSPRVGWFTLVKWVGGSEVTNRSAASLVWRDQYPHWIYLMLMAYVRSLYCFCSEAKLSEFSWKLCTAPFQRSWIAMFGWWPSLESIQGWCCRGDCGGSSGVSHAARNFGMDGWPVCIAQQWGSMSCYQVSPKSR